MEYEKKIVCCPKCGEKVATYDGKSTINVIGRCNTCYKRIIYNVKTKEITRTNFPPRATSSGTRFY